MEGKVFVLALLAFLSSWISVQGLVVEEPLPTGLKDCFESASMNNASNEQIIKERRHCLDNIHVKNDTDFITQDDIDFLNNILDQMLYETSRVKRQARTLSVRREVRNLTETEWNNFVTAVNTLKNDGTYDRLAAIHRGVFNLRSAHRGPNFFGWHRIYLLTFEWSLQRVNPSVTLPYWDSTLDFDTTNPTNSVLWTSRFFGNGNGLVTSGPFANWTTGQNERLMRNIGSGGTLMTKAAVDLVLSRNSHSEIIDTNNVLYYFEGYHDGPHVWIDGQMRVLESAAEDPVFFLHHCFIDYVWEQFRMRQQERGISPENDYPNVRGLHAPNRRMAGFNRLSNVQGYLNHWTDTFYTYLESATCGATEPDCYSPYLTCDITRERCVTVEGEVLVAAAFESNFGQSGSAAAFRVANYITPFKNDRLASLQGLYLQDAETFESIHVDSRTRDDPLPQIFQRFRPRRSRRITIGKRSVTNVENNTTIPETIYIPISIVSYRPYPTGLESIVTTNGEIINNLFPEGHDHKAVHLKSGSSVAFIQSDGISYLGHYTDVTVTDIEHLVSSAFAHAVVQDPKNESVTAVITVNDNFGRICKPVCLQGDNSTSPYKPCTGAIRVTSEEPRMFSFTHDDSVKSIWNTTDPFDPHVNTNKIFMKFICSN